MPAYKKILVPVFLLLNVYASAQGLAGDTARTENIPADFFNAYYDSLGSSMRLFNGIEYNRYGHGFTGSPFFNNTDFTEGSVFYDGALYEHVALLYDVVQDALIIKDFTKNYEMKLVKEKVRYFKILNGRFVNLSASNGDENLPEEGYYKLLVDGKVLALEKVEKKIETSSKAEEPTRFTTYERFYVKKGDDYYKIDNISNLLKAFKDKKTELRKFIRSNGLGKKDMEQLIQKTADYYNGITK